MVERAARSWFYGCESAAQREKKKRRRQLAEIPGTYKEKILREFNVSGVLSPLVYEGVFSLTEYHEVMSRGCHGKRVESFLLKLCSKGPKAFCAFCSHLEEFCPYLLTCFFLYYQEQTQRTLQDVSTTEGKAGAGTEPEPSGTPKTEGQGQEQGLPSFHKYRLTGRI